MGRGSGRGSGGGQAKLAQRNAATSRGAAQPPLLSTAHDSDSAEREDEQDLRAQNSALQESLAHAEARATAAQSRADAAEHELKVLREKGEEAEKGGASVVGGDSGGAGAAPVAQVQELRAGAANGSATPAPAARTELSGPRRRLGPDSPCGVDVQRGVALDDERASSPPRAAAQAACTEEKGSGMAALLLRGDETALRAAFARHADGRDSADQPIMSKEALVQAFDALHVQRGDEEIDELMARVDLDGSGTIDCEEFCQAIQGRSHLEMLLHGLPIVRALADQLGGSTVAYRRIHDDDVQNLVLGAVPLLVEIIQHNLASLRASAEASEAVSDAAQDAAGKFAFSIQGGDLQDFHAGLAERVGEPHADIARGMEKEHLESGDADIPFKTANYGLLTTPRKEWDLVESGGKGLADGDTRVLRPLEDLLKSETAQGAGITRPEMRAVVLYTGPMYQVGCAWWRRVGLCMRMVCSVHYMHPIWYIVYSIHYIAYST